MRYFEVDEHTLRDARPGLILMERLYSDEESIRPYIYGLTSKADVVEAANEAIAEFADEDEDGNKIEVPQVTEIALALPFSADVIYYLAGSGLILHDDDFEYMTPNEGSRSLSMRWSSYSPRVHASDFSVMALADNDMSIDEFLKQYGTKTQAPPVVKREPVPAVQASKKASQSMTATKLNSIDMFLAD